MIFGYVALVLENLVLVPDVLCVYTQHSGYRLSVDLAERLAGIDILVSKWRDRFLGDTEAVVFSKNWMFNTFVINSRRSLSDDRLRSISFAFRAICVYPLRRHGWQMVVFGLIGFRMARVLSVSWHWLIDQVIDYFFSYPK